ncbi:hypothetical protein GCM10007383_06360 [Arenibacter certesii]|uniref:Uncharacterized protein n=2 Tax=Arenibacter certesii TaxID=228955 RepID=A0A918IPV5_9FLAO|nr:hypothetical protein GCM10007383_06360 [Arenibacter certesii]
MSFTVDMHYCGKTLVDYSLFNKVASCGMETMQPVDIDSCSTIVDKCCKEENITIEGQDILKNSFEKFSYHQLVFVATYAYSQYYFYEGGIENIVPFVDYSPPFLIQDIHVLFETFLI